MVAVSAYTDEEIQARLDEEIALLRIRRQAAQLVDSEDPDTRYAELAAALVDTAGLRALPPPVPLVSEWLFRDTLAWLHGKPGNAKTFVAVDLACCVATGTPWHGHEVTRGSVLYVIAEGARGLSRRVDAWSTTHEGLIPEGVTFLPAAAQLINEGDVTAFARLLNERRPVLVVIDTQARASVGADENSAKDMGLLVANLERLRQACGACVLVVHHEPRVGENLRGHTALEGAADTLIRVTKDGALVEVANPKQKDAEEAPTFKLALRPVADSATLTRNLGTAAELMSASERAVLEALERLGGEASQTQLSEAAEVSKSTFYRVVSTLYERALVARSKDGRGVRYTLTTLAKRPTTHETPSRVDGQRPTSLTSDSTPNERSDLDVSHESHDTLTDRNQSPMSHPPLRGGTGLGPGQKRWL
ncbi:hypothetical protein BAY59_07540 [Prauserella coralliicola]|nr:hypothetical protein BAY59_07540 [Prauserella coralliicola]